jgi:hypothetical protein
LLHRASLEGQEFTTLTEQWHRPTQKSIQWRDGTADDRVDLQSPGEVLGAVANYAY